MVDPQHDVLDAQRRSNSVEGNASAERLGIRGWAFSLTGTASGNLAEGSSFLAEIGVESCSDGPDDEAILLVHENCTSGHKNKTVAKQFVQLRVVFEDKLGIEPMPSGDG